MADLRQLSKTTLQSIARQIGDRLHAARSSGNTVEPTPLTEDKDRPSDFEPFGGLKYLATAQFEIAESLEVWRLGAGALDTFALSQVDLVTLGRPTGTYHHQIKATAASGSEKTAVAFANSWPLGPELADWSVRDLFFSPLAAQIDEAIGRADDLLPEDAVTRLLSLPEYKIEALWFISSSASESGSSGDALRPTSHVIVISAPSNFTEPTMSLISSSDFLRTLFNITPGMGFIV